jgi:autotransporter-associated beta strand protein
MDRTITRIGAAGKTLAGDARRLPPRFRTHSYSAVRIVLGVIAWLGASQAQAQLRICTYNVTATDATLTAPRPGMDVILTAIGSSARGGFARPIDVLVLEEARGVGTTGVQFAKLLNTIYGGTAYLPSAIDGGSTGSGRPICIYNSASVNLVDERAIGVTSSTGQPRQTLRYEFRPVGYESTADFYVYASHFKASNSSSDAARRNVEARANRADLDALGNGVSAIQLGDLNIYTSTDPSFQTLTAAGAGQFFDPVDSVGSWSGNAAFSAVHTQSPATTAYFGGQVTGGIDDRFDYQLTTGELLDGRGMDYLTDSYWAFGNTNTHTMKGAITTGSPAALAALLPGYTNTQASSVLTALSQVTDHLPVVADYQLPAKMSASLAALPATVIRGASVSANLAVSNAAPVAVSQGADRLDYGFTGTGILAVTGTGSDMALGSASTHALSVNTSSPGSQAGSITVAATSPQASAPTFTQNVTMGVLDHAIGSFAAATTVTSLDIDFGTLTQGSGTSSRNFSVFNRAGTLGSSWTAKLDLDSVSASGSTGVFATTLSPFANLASGSSRTYSLSMFTATSGSFSGSYLLRLSDEDLPGATSQTISLTVRGVVAAGVITINVSSGTQTQTAAGRALLVGTTPVEKTGAGTLVLDQANTVTASTTVQQGILELAHAVALATSPVHVSTNTTLSVAPALQTSIGGLQLAAGGLVDVGTGMITVANGLLQSDLVTALQSGRADGSWAGASGITSSAVAMSIAFSVPRSVGWRDNGDGSLAFGYAAQGDTNLDWSVDILDAGNFITGGKFDTSLLATWGEGDFNYDDAVDILDAAEFFAAGLYDAGPYNSATGSIAAVPEPNVLVLAGVGFGFMGLMAARRNRAD